MLAAALRPLRRTYPALTVPRVIPSANPGRWPISANLIRLSATTPEGCHRETVFWAKDLQFAYRIKNKVRYRAVLAN